MVRNAGPLVRCVLRFRGMEGEFRFCSLGCLGVCCRSGGGTNFSLRLLLALRLGVIGLLFVLAWAATAVSDSYGRRELGISLMVGKA